MDLNKFFYDLDEFIEKGMTEEAVHYVQQTMEEAEKAGDKQALVAIYNEAGSICRDFSKYSEAETYYLEALKLIDEVGASGSEIGRASCRERV